MESSSAQNVRKQSGHDERRLRHFLVPLTSTTVVIFILLVQLFIGSKLPIAASTTSPLGSNQQCSTTSQGTTTETNPRIRGDWDLISPSERELFLQAIELSIDRGYYQRFIAMHADATTAVYSHESCAFALFHRTFVLAFENMLRSLDGENGKFACLTLPYWNIMEHHLEQRNGKCDSLGGCARVMGDLGGSPYSYGDERLYAGVEMEGGLCKDRPLTRLKDDLGRVGIVREDGTVEIPDTCSYETLIQLIASSSANEDTPVSYAEFTHLMQKGIHDAVHDNIGGMMPSMASPSDPLFLVWHSSIDLFLYLWETCHLDHSNNEKNDETASAQAARTSNRLPPLWAFGESSNFQCSYSSDAKSSFPHINATSELYMKIDTLDIRNDPLIGIYFQEIGMDFSDVANVRENLYPHYEFTYTHLTKPLWNLLQDAQKCPRNAEQLFSAVPTSSPIIPPPTFVLPPNERAQFQITAKKLLEVVYPGNPAVVNSCLSFITCYLLGPALYEALPEVTGFITGLVNGTIRTNQCDFFLSNVPKATVLTTGNNEVLTSTSRPAETIVLDWVIPQTDDAVSGTLPARTVRVGDTVRFEWDSQWSHNVYKIPQNTCDFTYGITIGEISGTKYTVTSEDADMGEIFFACEISGHCDMGQMVTIIVVNDNQLNAQQQQPEEEPQTIRVNWIIPTSDDDSALATQFPTTRVRVGDTVSFEWERGSHNVFLHPSQTCLEVGAVFIGRNNGGLNTVVTYTFAVEDEGQRLTFACDLPDHCEMGQIMTFIVGDYEEVDEPSDTTITPPIEIPSNQYDLIANDDVNENSSGSRIKQHRILITFFFGIWGCLEVC